MAGVFWRPRTSQAQGLGERLSKARGRDAESFCALFTGGHRFPFSVGMVFCMSRALTSPSCTVRPEDGVGQRHTIAASAVEAPTRTRYRIRVEQRLASHFHRWALGDMHGS